jgi:hypothetical protein
MESKTNNTTDLSKHHVHKQNKAASGHRDKVEIAVKDFIKVYDSRASFFEEDFVEKVKNGKRKALAEIQRYPMPPTCMDLRQVFSKCINEHVPDDHIFNMSDGKTYTMLELKRLVPEWAQTAIESLMASDPALADRLMSPTQWNARSAFEVTFVSAMNELKDIKKTNLMQGSFDHYLKWLIVPLEKAVVEVKAVNTPGNSLIGYGERISITEAIETAQKVRNEFKKLLEKR